MPNHIHVLIAFCNTGKSINFEIGEGKRFMAYEIVKRLNSHYPEILLELQCGVNQRDLNRNKKHNVWEDSFDWKWCNSKKFILQKLQYIHNNPCKGKWQLVNSPVAYEYSSAQYYTTGVQGHFTVTGYLQLKDIDLTKPPG